MSDLSQIESFESLKKEQKLVILLSRLTFSDDITEKAKKILKDGLFDWFEFYKYAMYHKTAVICWKNISKISYEIYPPKYLNDCMNYIYLSTKERNNLYQVELNKLVEKLELNSIKCIPVKGIMLIQSVYKDYGLRYSGDSDFLIKYSNIEKLETVLSDLGYIKGYYNFRNKEITPVSRLDSIKWKTFMSNLHPYIKKSNNELFPVYKLDFRYSLDDTLSKDPIDEIINSFMKTNIVKPSHYLIHLCTHFYDEAKHTIDIKLAKDLNLIKLCDIREYIISNTKHNDLNELIDFAIKFSLEKQVYYTMYFLDLIYNDGYERTIMNKLNIVSDYFIHTFSENTAKYGNIFKKNIWQRLFSCNNIDEIKN